MRPTDPTLEPSGCADGKERRRWRPVVALHAIAAALLTAPALFAQAPVFLERPVPGPVSAPGFHRSAVLSGTRSMDGGPGPAYWQQHTTYRLEAYLEPEAARLTGRATIVYENRSPESLQMLVLNLYQNLHALGVVRNEPQEVTGGVELLGVRVDGRTAPPVEMASSPPAYQVQGTILVIALPTPLGPGASAELELEWAFAVPQSGAGRMGHSEREVYFMAYWFPKMAVFDDLRGWDAEPYQGIAEFYDGFGDYEVSITVPAGWTVMGTGDLLNGGEVLSPQTLERLRQAATADTVVRIATEDDVQAGRVVLSSPASGELTYRFRADNVRDFAWTASNTQIWDATSAVVPDRNGDGAAERVSVHTFWRPERAPLWAEQALYAKHALEYHSGYTGLPYPWPHMTSVEGDDIIAGGMEFPMMSLIGAYQGLGHEDLYGVTSHEVAHMWLPMIVSTNERRYAWMDEGATTFLENESRVDRFPGSAPFLFDRETYLQVAGTGLEQPLMRHGDYYEPGPGYGIASYPKPSALLHTLRALIGEDAFMAAYRAFLEEWAYKHPTPWDLFNTFERFAGQDLDWFWQSFFYETWTLDHGIESVEVRGGAPVVVVVDYGWAVLPMRLTIETTLGGTLFHEVPVTEWLLGRTRVAVPLPASVGQVTSVRIDPGVSFLDADPSDNQWTLPPGMH